MKRTKGLTEKHEALGSDVHETLPMSRRVCNDGSRLTIAQNYLYVYLVDHADVDGISIVSKGEIAADLGISERTVDRAVKRLREESFIEVVPRYDDCGGRLANAYRIVSAGVVE